MVALQSVSLENTSRGLHRVPDHKRKGQPNTDHPAGIARPVTSSKTDPYYEGYRVVTGKLLGDINCVSYDHSILENLIPITDQLIQCLYRSVLDLILCQVRRTAFHAVLVFPVALVYYLSVFIRGMPYL